MEGNKENPKLEQNQKEKPMTERHKTILTGFIGGLFWGLLGSIAYYFNFTEVSHASYTLRSFWHNGWTEGFSGELISILIVSILSIIAAFIYYFLLRKRPGMIPGILFGGVLWLVFLYFLNPFFSQVPTLTEMSMTTVVTTICLFILYGTFIGYSISYENEVLQEEAANKKKSSQNTG